MMTNLPSPFTKTLLLQGLILKPSQVPLGELHHLHDYGTPSAWVHVWIGQTVREIGEGPTPQNVEPKTGLAHNVMVRNVWVSPVRINRLFAIVAIQPGDTYEPIRLPIEADACLARIWPPQESVIDWPPPEVIDRPTYLALRSMIVVAPPWTVQAPPREQPT